jgi:hypothetical protein
LKEMKHSYEEDHLEEGSGCEGNEERSRNAAPEEDQGRQGRGCGSEGGKR